MSEPKLEIPTPRTDALLEKEQRYRSEFPHHNHPKIPSGLVDFARQLEREITVLGKVLFDRDTHIAALEAKLAERLRRQVEETLNKTELNAIATVLTNCAKAEGEDLIGLFMKHGVFHMLKDGDLVKLAEKLEKQLPSNSP